MAGINGYAAPGITAGLSKAIQALALGGDVRQQAQMQAGLTGAQTAKLGADARSTDYLTDMRQNPEHLRAIENLFGKGAVLAYQSGGDADKFGANAMDLQKYQFRDHVLRNIGDPGTDQASINMATAMLEGKTHMPYSNIANTGHVMNQDTGEMRLSSPELFNVHAQNAQTARASRQQVVDTPNGLMIVDPSSGVAFPVTGENGVPLQGQRAFEAQAATRKQQEAQTQAFSRLQSLTDDMDRMAKLASEIVDDPNLYRAVGVLGMLPNIPGMAGADITARLNTLKYQVGFGVLQAMREASKTGGALGAVSDRENEMLQNALVAMDRAQSPEQLREALRDLINYTNRVKARMTEAYTKDYGALPDGFAAATTANSSSESTVQPSRPVAPQRESEDPRLAEIRRRAKSDPAFAERARQMGYL